MKQPERGVLFVVSGPSGVGKSTLLKVAMKKIEGLTFSVSATTRGPRKGEADGVDYHFLSNERFAELVAEDAFVEHATVYDRSYGTLKSEVESKLEQGLSVVLDIDVQGAQQVRQSVPDAVFVHLLPPSIQALRERLHGRGTDSQEIIEGRMAAVRLQVEGAQQADYVVVNDDLEDAHRCFQAVILGALCQRPLHQRFVDELLAN